MVGVGEPGTMIKYHGTDVVYARSEAVPGLPPTPPPPPPIALVPSLCHSSLCFLALLPQPVGCNQPTLSLVPSSPTHLKHQIHCQLKSATETEPLAETATLILLV